MYTTINDQENVCKIGDYHYSPIMYLKKVLSPQPMEVAANLLELLQEFDADGKFYHPRESAQQPPDACGIPQRLLDLQRKKWIRSDRIAEEHEDHARKLQFEDKETDLWEKLQARRHILGLEHKEDLSLQRSMHSSDDHGRGFEFRNVDHRQSYQQKQETHEQRYIYMAQTHVLESGLGWQKHNSRMLMDE